MPNWVDTGVTVYAKNKDDLIEFINCSTAGYHIKESTENCEKNLAPMPEEKEAYKGYFSFGAITGVSDNYSDNWYEESLMIWGTKWEARGEGNGISKQDLLDNIADLTALKESEWKIATHFRMMTAWSFPEAFWITCSKEFPNLIFSFTAQEEGGFFLLAGAVNNNLWCIDDIDPDELLKDVEINENNPYESWDVMQEEFVQWMDQTESNNLIRLLQKMEAKNVNAIRN